MGLFPKIMDATEEVSFVFFTIVNQKDFIKNCRTVVYIIYIYYLCKKLNYEYSYNLTFKGKSSQTH